jgi:FlaA1/EpsC-like NDP-sugar epimerase
MNSSLVTFQKVLNREATPAFFSPEEVNIISNERFLITGAGGSIGSRIVKLLSTIPGVVFLATDRDESALHSLSLSLNTSALFDSNNFELLDIRDLQGMEICFSDFKPTVVIHAAALKHLSVLQKQPREAILTNVFGTLDLIDLSIRSQVKKFVNISTDKAAQPTSILGISKLIGEFYTAHQRKLTNFSYTSCRFGNVFNSRGSVIETFIRQMEVGAPITLTHPEITRYFMHTDEAAFLTLKSLLINKGDIHVFDMGEPVRIIDVITKMQEILLTDSQILVTGLREGEKLNEILFEDESLLVDSGNPLIRVLNFDPKKYEKFCDSLDRLNSRDIDFILQLLRKF